MERKRSGNRPRTHRRARRSKGRLSVGTPSRSAGQRWPARPGPCLHDEYPVVRLLSFVRGGVALVSRSVGTLGARLHRRLRDGPGAIRRVSGGEQDSTAELPTGVLRDRRRKTALGTPRLDSRSVWRRQACPRTIRRSRLRPGCHPVSATGQSRLRGGLGVGARRARDRCGRNVDPGYQAARRRHAADPLSRRRPWRLSGRAAVRDIRHSICTELWVASSTDCGCAMADGFRAPSSRTF